MGKKLVNAIETERLLIREIEECDADNIVTWRNGDAHRFFRNPILLKKEDHLKWFHGAYQNNTERIDCIIELKDTQVAIGSCGICVEDTSAEIGYLVAPEYQGCGYATEAILALEHYQRGKLPKTTFCLTIYKENEASIRLADFLGYTKVSEEGDFFYYEKCVCIANENGF